MPGTPHRQAVGCQQAALLLTSAPPPAHPARGPAVRPGTHVPLPLTCRGSGAATTRNWGAEKNPTASRAPQKQGPAQLSPGRSHPAPCSRLAEAAQRQAVAALPAGPLRGAGLAGLVALGAQTAVGLAGRGQAAQLAVLVHRVADPVDAGILHVNPAAGTSRVAARSRKGVMFPCYPQPQLNHPKMNLTAIALSCSVTKQCCTAAKLTLRMAAWAGSTRMTSKYL